MKITDITNINEAPIGDYETIGNFDKNSSIRDPRDRSIISNPKSIERVKSKFDNTSYNFNLYFVNMPKATRHKEVGEVDEEWVIENLGQDVMDKVGKGPSGINIIFTNNSGAERVPMTPWIMAHRIGHALVREKGMNQFGNHSNPMAYAFSDFIRHTSYVLENVYGLENRGLPENVRQLSSASRPIQLLYKNYWQAICTFRSARQGNLRDWFEVNNEMIAQYITTGSVRFNDLPDRFKSGKSYISLRRDGDDIAISEGESMHEMMSEMMEQEYERVLSYATDRIYVM